MIGQYWELLKEFWGSLCGFGLAVGVGITLIVVAIFGPTTVYENNPIVLYGELSAVWLIAVLEIERFISDVRTKWNASRKQSGKG